MRVLIFANCQGRAIYTLLSRRGISTAFFHNFYYVFQTVLDNQIKDELMNCDYFIYQPLSSIYPVYNTENLKKYLKNDCKTISFPYIYNDAFSPIFKSLKYDIPLNGEYSIEDTYSIVYKNIEPIILLKNKGLLLEEVLRLYDENMIDFKYKDRFENSIKILHEKEIHTDVKVSQFILENHIQYKLFNYHTLNSDGVFCNHPSSILILYYVNQVYSLMGIEQIISIDEEMLGDVMLVSRYDIAFYNYKWINKESERIDTIIRNLIIEIYTNF